MPIYEYKCSLCGNVVEEFSKKIHDRPVYFTPCEPCGDVWSRRKHHRIMSACTFHLMPGTVPWGAGRYSSAALTGDTPVSIDEP